MKKVIKFSEEWNFRAPNWHYVLTLDCGHLRWLLSYTKKTPKRAKCGECEL
jgi:hypothetical protein